MQKTHAALSVGKLLRGCFWKNLYRTVKASSRANNHRRNNTACDDLYMPTARGGENLLHQVLSLKVVVRGVEASGDYCAAASSSLNFARTYFALIVPTSAIISVPSASA